MDLVPEGDFFEQEEVAEADDTPPPEAVEEPDLALPPPVVMSPDAVPLPAKKEDVEKVEKKREERQRDPARPAAPGSAGAQALWRAGRPCGRFGRVAGDLSRAYRGGVAPAYAGRDEPRLGQRPCDLPCQCGRRPFEHLGLRLEPGPFGAGAAHRRFLARAEHVRLGLREPGFRLPLTRAAAGQASAASHLLSDTLAIGDLTMFARITLALLAATVAQTARAEDAKPAAPAPAPRVATPSPAAPAPAPNAASPAAAPAPAPALSESKFSSALYSAIAKRTPQTSPAGEGEVTASFHRQRARQDRQGDDRQDDEPRARRGGEENPGERRSAPAPGRLDGRRPDVQVSRRRRAMKRSATGPAVRPGLHGA